MKFRSVIVIGSGGHAKVVIATLLASGREVYGILDDDPCRTGQSVLGIPVLGTTARATDFAHLDAIIAIGDNDLRQRIANRFDLHWTIAIHPSAVVHDNVSVGPGTVVFAGAVVQPGAKIGAHTIINTAASVDHDCDVGSFVHIAPGTLLGGTVKVGNGALLGIGTRVCPNLEIGAWAVVGAGGVAVADISPWSTNLGIPTRPVRTVGNKLRRAFHLTTQELLLPTTSLKCGFISPKDSKWTAYLTRIVHDFYHLPQYVQLCAKLENAVALAFYAEEGDSAGLVPLLCVASPGKAGTDGDWCDLKSPYGYPSPLTTCPADLDFTRRFLNALRSHADAVGVSSIFVRLHPILSDPSCMPPLRLSAVRCHSATVSVDLMAPKEETWRQMRSSHRHEIRRLERMGFSVFVDDWQRYNDFIGMYRETMGRLHADTFYFFEDRYFEELRRLLGDSLHLCSVVSPEGAPAAGALFTTVGRIAEYHLSASNPLFQRLAPTKLLLHRFGSWARAHGCSVLHLGGGVGARQDALFSFKTGFSPRRHGFATLRMIVNEERYRILTGRASAASDVQEDLQAESFPPYRDGTAPPCSAELGEAFPVQCPQPVGPKKITK